MRGPLYILIPVAAVVSTAVIGIGFGILNLEVREATDSAIGPVVSAGLLTVLIMGVATYLSLRSPDPEE